MKTALDTRQIQKDIPGCCTIWKNIDPNFIIATTKNPKLRDSVIKEMNYRKNFISRFTVVEFPSFDLTELRTNT